MISLAVTLAAGEAKAAVTVNRLRLRASARIRFRIHSLSKVV
jgi:hypothetical protein